MNRGQSNSHWMDLAISHLLRAGVLVAGVFLFVGWLWQLRDRGFAMETFRQYQPQSFFHSFHEALATGNTALLISYIGLGILVCLPLSRVLMTGVLFIRDKDYALAIMALLVFGALVGSFALGIEI